MSSLPEVLSAATLGPTEVPLTCKGLGFVYWDCSDCEFEFVFGADKVCRVPSILAEFLSPKIACLRRCDISFDVYTFKNGEMFNLFESLVSSLRSDAALQVEKSNFSALLRLSQELENMELFSSLLGIINAESLTLEEAILLLRFGMDRGATFSGPFRKLSDFIASHFYQIEQEILSNLDLETLERLLSSSSLRIEDEDSLYDFILSRAKRDLRFASLFEFVYFEYLSVNRIRSFTPFVDKKLLQTMNYGTWTQIGHRLARKSCKRSDRNPRNYGNIPEAEKGKVFFYKRARKLDGIIAYLTNQWHGNVHIKGVVNVTALTVCEDSRRAHPKNAVDLGTRSSYVSVSVPSSWLCLDFMDQRVIPTSYTLVSVMGVFGGFVLRNWVIEVSNDGDSWMEIDRRDLSIEGNEISRTEAHFRIPCVLKKSFRYLRLRQIGTNNFGDDRLIVSALEIFGTLVEQGK